ncbi:hypothetical protein J1N35_018939 [Gossypium stocksii]|uniref:Uncharacterized protein n=1 Tax=Gossypium stocksii TaxID=47602 RepID=A0A9D3VR08_9ROSI|nr:hypothetical protein J1N35_018939 [Gossypium stocksii]
MNNGVTSANDVGRLTRKVKRRTDKPPDPDDLVVNEKRMRVEGVGTQSASWKEKLIGSTPAGANVQQEEDFELGDGDAKMEIIDGVPSITFSSRVHQFIAKQMARTMIVKLLRRRILYFTMGRLQKFDRNTNSSSRGQFARLVVFIDLGKPLVSKVKIDGSFNVWSMSRCHSYVLNVGDLVTRATYALIDRGKRRLSNEYWTVERDRTPNKSSYVDNLFIPIDVVIENLVQGLSKSVACDMVMMGGDTASIEAEDQMLVDSEKA